MNKKNILLSILTLSLLGTSAHAFENVSGCAEADYVTIDGPTANITIQSPFFYSPRCLKVKVGTTVKIQASVGHPLQGQRDVRGVVNPFRADRSFTNATAKTLTKPGFYGYFCEVHGDDSGGGMSGAIQVVQ